MDCFNALSDASVRARRPDDSLPSAGVGNPLGDKQRKCTVSAEVVASAHAQESVKGINARSEPGVGLGTPLPLVDGCNLASAAKGCVGEGTGSSPSTNKSTARTVLLNNGGTASLANKWNTWTRTSMESSGRTLLSNGGTASLDNKCRRVSIVTDPVLKARTPSPVRRKASLLSAQTVEDIEAIKLKRHCTAQVSEIAHEKSATRLVTGKCCLELFAGSAGITAEWRRVGADALGVDWVRNRSSPRAPVVTMDLTKKEPQGTLLRGIQEQKVAFVLMAPPCGTASKAREIPISKEKLRPGQTAPAPLRSSEHPYGLPSLKDTDLLRVQLANELYAFTCRVATAASEVSVPWIVENPASSYFWELREVKALLDLPHVHDE